MRVEFFSSLKYLRHRMLSHEGKSLDLYELVQAASTSQTALSTRCLTTIKVKVKIQCNSHS